MPHVDRGWSAEKGHYGGGDAGETMSNAALLLVHATTARFGHTGVARQDERARMHRRAAVRRARVARARPPSWVPARTDQTHGDGW